MYYTTIDLFHIMHGVSLKKVTYKEIKKELFYTDIQTKLIFQNSIIMSLECLFAALMIKTIFRFGEIG